MPDLTLKCRITGKAFVVSEWEQAHLQKMGMPLPTLCIEERHRRRLCNRNERRIYKDKCDLTGRSIISLYSPDKTNIVYSQEAWWSDDWDPKSYGRDFDFNRGFFEQFKALRMDVPRFSLLNTLGENSEYCNVTTSNKNCYLVFGGDFNEDCIYSVFSMHCRNCSDLYWVNRAELCYDLVDCTDAYNLKYSQNSYNCRDGAFLYECRGLSNCFMCVGLRNKQYYILNKPYSAEEYAQKMAQINFGSYEAVVEMKKRFAEFKFTFPHRYAHIINSENATGDNLGGVKNAVNCFDVEGPAEDIKDVMLGGWGLKDALSCDHVGHKLEMLYEILGSIGSYNCALGTFYWDSKDILYSDMVVNNCRQLFGCTGMRKSEFCILNKQYTEKEYFEMKALIIEHMKNTGEWGEFWPMQDSMWCYNETVANDYFPLSKEEILARGLKWFDEEKVEIGSGDAVPDSIDEVSENILGATFICDESGRPYKINETELKFCKRLNIPIPHHAPETRNMTRFNSRLPRRSFERKCDKCGLAILSSYGPERKEKVYCEKCFLESLD